MIEVDDVYESDIAIYKIVRETKCKYFIERTNKNNHPCSPNKKFNIHSVWKNTFNVNKLKKI